MERLTEWFDDGILKGVLVKEEYGEQSIKTIFEENDEGYRGMCTLKAYEDTGLTPEQIMELKERDTAKEPVQFGDEDELMLRCPHCDENVTDLIECGFDFCPYCGGRWDG